jgi:hypothetical protein
MMMMMMVVVVVMMNDDGSGGQDSDGDDCEQHDNGKCGVQNHIPNMFTCDVNDGRVSALS